MKSYIHEKERPRQLPFETPFIVRDIRNGQLLLITKRSPAGLNGFCLTPARPRHASIGDPVFVLRVNVVWFDGGVTLSNDN